MCQYALKWDKLWEIASVDTSNSYPIVSLLSITTRYKNNFDQRATSVDSTTVLIWLSQTLICVCV